MPTNTGPSPRILWGVLGITLLAGAIFLSNRTADTPEGIPVITDRGGYIDAVKKAEQLSKDILLAADKGKEPSTEEADKVRECAKIFDGIIRFQPQMVQPYFSSGRCYELIGQKQTARERYEQAIRNKSFENTDFGKIAAVEASYRLAQLVNEEGDYKKALGIAEPAIKEFYTLTFADDQTAVRNGLAAKYYTGIAKIQIQLKAFKEAKESLEKAITFAPGYPDAITLQKFLQSEAK